MFIASGSTRFAKIFRDDHLTQVDCLILCDPELKSYQAMGWQKSLLALFNPATLLRGAGAFRQGYRQSAVVQGDPLQNGGLLVTDQAGHSLYQYASTGPGDHPEIEKVLQVLKSHPQN